MHFRSVLFGLLPGWSISPCRVCVVPGGGFGPAGIKSTQRGLFFCSEARNSCRHCRSGLTDSELRILLDLARPLQLAERGRFLEIVGERLRGHGSELGDGTISRIAREARRAVFRPPLAAGDAAPLIKIES